ncbi:BglG family transcription antiterminator [Salimicrobium halophilum]|uniref:Ascorbate-specific PTS system EIIA component n=1 Tax=Salimicrobium halophilum TaxID=86666 RepID=A0A1G8UX97_9BACI|nr:BglG family transcription antiterminator [Salimicrobium halophilum]SDJ58428.1 Transcriptional antiterminator [Salimicrobium halophilum]
MLDKRAQAIMSELLAQPYISSKQLEKKQGLTRRQLGYRIGKLNEYLLEKGLPVVERTRQGYFDVPSPIAEFFQKNDQEIIHPDDAGDIHKEERLDYLLVYLMTGEEEITLAHLISFLGVSKNTVLHEMKSVRRKLASAGLDIHYTRQEGYFVTGNEFSKRRILIRSISNVLNRDGGEINLRNFFDIEQTDVLHLKSLIERMEEKLGIKYTDENLRLIPYILLLLLRRLRLGHRVELDGIAYEELSNTKEYRVTEHLLKEIDDVPDSERLFITLYILTSRLSSIQESDPGAVPELYPAIEEMLSRFEKSACVTFEKRRELLEQLLQHITPAYFRIKYRLTDLIYAPEVFSRELRDIHHIVKQSLAPLERMIGTVIPENESAYISMLIGGWMRRQGESLDEKTKAVVVCPHGVSVSRLLFNELDLLFPEFVFLDYLSVREFEAYSLDYDVVFSSAPIPTEKKLFLIRPLLKEEEKNRLRQQVLFGLHDRHSGEIDVREMLNIISSYADIQDEEGLVEGLKNYFDAYTRVSTRQPEKEQSGINLHSLLPPSHIQRTEEVRDWEEAVRSCASPLVQEEYITPDYVQKMIHASSNDPYIILGKRLAIPHAAPEDGVKRMGMSMLSVRNGVSYAGTDIYWIVVIAAVDKHQHMTALMQLMEIAQNRSLEDQVLNAASAEEIYRILRRVPANTVT